MGVECQWCCKWEHRVCVDLSQSEYNMLTNSSNKIMFFCILFLKSPLWIKSSQNLKPLQGLKTQVDNRQEIIHKDDSDDSFTYLATSIVAEQKEKEKRQLNLILHKVEESVEEEPSNRKKTIYKSYLTFTEFVGVETTITNAIRIRKKGIKLRLLKMGIINLQDKISILRSKKKFKAIQIILG